MTFDIASTDAGTTAAQAFTLRSGVCQDITHVFLAAARHLEMPARYVSGYFYRADGVVDQDAGHAWAEAKVPDLGWVGFDPTNGISPTEAHVRVAIGLDAVGAARCGAAAAGGIGGAGREAAGDVRPPAGPELTPGRAARGDRAKGDQMTYCAGVLVEGGLVMIADTRTNAGLDNISTYRKLHLFESEGERVLALASAGNLSVSQAVVSLLGEGTETRIRARWRPSRDAPTMFPAPPNSSGVRSGRVRGIDGPALEEAEVRFDVAFLFGGQIAGGPMRFYMIYPAQFHRMQPRCAVPADRRAQIRKAILDRAVSYGTDLYDALKIALISMDSTMRSNLSVGLPIDIAVMERDALATQLVHRIEVGDPYFHDLRERWSTALRAAHMAIPPPPYGRTQSRTSRRRNGF